MHASIMSFLNKNLASNDAYMYHSKFQNCHFFRDFHYTNAKMILVKKIGLKNRTVIFNKLFVTVVSVEAKNVSLVLPETPKEKILNQKIQRKIDQREKVKEGERYCFLASLSKIADFKDPNDAIVSISLLLRVLQ